DFGAAELDALLRQRVLQAEIAHHSADDRPDQLLPPLALASNDVEQLIAVDQPAEVIHHHEAIAVAVESNARQRLHARHRQLQQLRGCRAAAQIDVAAVRRAADRHDLGAEVREDARADFVAGAVRAIDHDLHARQVQPRHRGHAEFLVTHARLVDARGTPELARNTGHRRLFEMLLDARLDLVRKLGAVPIEELDAVVVVQIVRRADDDAEVAFEALRQVSDARGRQRTHQHDVDPGSDEARFERGLEHVARESRVLAHEHSAALGGEHARCSAREAQRKVDSERMLADATAHAVGSEVFSCHDGNPLFSGYCLQPTAFPASLSATATFTASTVAATSCVRTMLAPARTAAVATATPPATRSSTARPSSTPNIDLRDTPISTGQPRPVSAGSPASRARLCSRRLPKPIPGSTTRRSPAMPLARQAAARSRRKSHTSATTSP